MPSARIGPVRTPPKIHLGDLTITALDGGGLWLDGGAMFGIIPKPLWSKLVQVDAFNRIPLATTCFLTETAGKKILVETGTGPAAKYDDKEQGFFSFSPYWIVNSLEAIGVGREEIDLVILTHLHFDHAGGGTIADGRGGYGPTFPRAKYVVQRGEWEDAVTGHAVMSGTYRPQNLAPLEVAGVLSLIGNAPAEICPGITVRPMPGHTRHQQAVIFESGGKRAILPGDLMPTAAHAGLRYNMAYDLLPFENMVNKKALLEELAGKGDLLFIGQDPAEFCWRSSQAQGRFSLAPVNTA